MFTRPGILRKDPVQGAGQNHPQHKLHQAHDLPRAKRRAANRGEYLDGAIHKGDRYNHNKWGFT